VLEGSDKASSTSSNRQASIAPISTDIDDTADPLDSAVITAQVSPHLYSMTMCAICDRATPITAPVCSLCERMMNLDLFGGHHCKMQDPIDLEATYLTTNNMKVNYWQAAASSNNFRDGKAVQRSRFDDPADTADCPDPYVRGRSGSDRSAAYEPHVSTRSFDMRGYCRKCGGKNPYDEKAEVEDFCEMCEKSFWQPPQSSYPTDHYRQRSIYARK
jgi:hypothetical protein